MADIPHFAFPFRFEDGKVVEVEQDSIDDVASCVHAILSVEVGELISLPEFGVPDLVFIQEGATPGDVAKLIENQEPRLDITIEEGWDFDQFIQYLRVSIKGADVG